MTNTSPCKIQLFEELLAVFNKTPSKIVLTSPEDGDYSYQDLINASSKMANTLKSLGVKPNEVVAAQIEKSVHNLFLYLACLQSNVIYLPLNPQYTASELSYFIKDAKPVMFVCDPAKAEVASTLNHNGDFIIQTLDSRGEGSLRDLYEQQGLVFKTDSHSENDIAALLYTSGTTGKPKAAMLTHQALYRNALSINKIWALNEKDIVLHVLPLFHAHGLFFALHSALLAGSTLLWLPKFDTNSVMAQLPKASIFMGIPTYYTRLLNNPDFNTKHCQSIRLFTSGSAPLLSSIFDAFKLRTGHDLVERYGMTETGINTSNPIDGEKKAGTVGMELPGVSLRIANDLDMELKTGEIGSIQVKGDNLFKGYLNLPDKTKQAFTQDGYFRTGDMGSKDEQGYLTIVGRVSDLIISGGLNVYPKEIELVLDAIDGVEESAVIGVPHPDFVEAVVAVVIRSSNANELTESAILEHLKRNLAPYKLPKKIFFEDALPRNAMAKVQKKDLKIKLENTFIQST